MRTQLAKINEVRTRFRGTFAREGKKYFGIHETKTLLLTNVTEVLTGKVVTDHLWLNWTQGFAALGPLAPGDVVEFDARVKSYEKGYFGYREDYKPVETDYKLSHPTRIERTQGEPVRERDYREQ